MKKRRLFGRSQVVGLITRAARFSFRSQLLTVWLGLCALGFVVGLEARPDPHGVPYEELFENMSVASFRDSPSDTAARFVVELASRDRVFRRYDVDARRFLAPIQGRDYQRMISGTRYPALRVRGHVDRGMWLEVPDSTRPSLLPDEFEELYRTTLDYVRPVSIVTNVLSTLSGYSIGYRLATWNSSLSNPGVQERVLATPGIGRAIAREAWKRVLLEPVIAVQDRDAARFASASATERIYTNFFRVAVNDSNGFIPAEAARLDSAGCGAESRAMLAFAHAARCAAADTCALRSADFAAVENWALLLDRHGHWSYRSMPASAAERLRYIGTLAWYGIAPEAGGSRRLWVGPRLLVQAGDTQGYVSDEIPYLVAGCPVAWRAWLRGDASHPSGNAWTAQWLAESRQIAPLVNFAMGIARAVRGRPEAVAAGGDADEDPAAASPRAQAAASAPATATARAPAASPASSNPAPSRLPGAPGRLAADTSWIDSTWVLGPVGARGDSSGLTAARADSASVTPGSPPPPARVLRANMTGPNP